MHIQGLMLPDMIIFFEPHIDDDLGLLYAGKPFRI